eukprot:12496150-Heterocapsa_arctica.AAC.1
MQLRTSRSPYWVDHCPVVADCWHRLWFDAARNQRALLSSWDLQRMTTQLRDRATARQYVHRLHDWAERPE